MPGDDEIPDHVIISGLEFAVGIAAAGSKLRPQLVFPSALRQFFKFRKLPPAALGRVRNSIEADDEFRAGLARAAAAAPELLDPVGLLWLTRPEGWREQIVATLADARPDDLQADVPSGLRRAERRREAAESAARRSLAEIAVMRADLDRATELAVTSAVEIAELRAEVDLLQRDLAVARTTSAATCATRQAERAQASAQLSHAVARGDEMARRVVAESGRADAAERTRDEVLASRAASEPTQRSVLAGTVMLGADISTQALEAQQLANRLQRIARALDELEQSAHRGTTVAPDASTTRAGAGRKSLARAVARVPIGVPGGLYGSSVAAVEHVVRHPGVIVFVDGYNVAKLRWPTLELGSQRDRCVELCEDLARRWGTNIVVVFDGADVPGATATRRQLVRVTYSPEGVSADDVVRREVGAQPTHVGVAVVTNDQQIIADVRAMGANPISSDLWLELATRR